MKEKNDIMDDYKMILVTGGAGFIGKKLVDNLLKEECDVKVFDITKPSEGVQWIEGNLLNYKDVLRACKDSEYIFHLASIADVYYAMSNPKLCEEINETGFSNLIRAAIKCEVNRIILASTVWVYGNKSINVLTEDLQISPVNHIYAKTKAKQEEYLYSGDYGLEYTILRYESSYGFGMRTNTAIERFVRRARKKKNITIYGSGEQGRCFIHVDDVVNGTISALTSQASNQIYNIAGRQYITINQVINQLQKHFLDISIIYERKRDNDYFGAKVCIEKAKKDLNWEPKINFFDWFDTYIQNKTILF